ncbi:hypothetical protein D3X11_06720 [Streptococcus sp. X16XC17]|nr:hypothetical protein D3X11_06720 [Streptococcus sp. X16XC17]
MKVIADNLVQEDLLKYESTLFSEIESNYISFVLDDKKYGNGLKIRNRYAHARMARASEEENFKNYLELIQILIFYVIRINDELEYFWRNILN